MGQFCLRILLKTGTHGSFMVDLVYLAMKWNVSVQ